MNIMRFFAFLLIGTGLMIGTISGVRAARECAQTAATAYISDACDPSCGFHCQLSQHAGAWTCSGPWNICLNCDDSKTAGTVSVQVTSATGDCTIALECSCIQSGPFVNNGTTKVGNCINTMNCA